MSNDQETVEQLAASFNGYKTSDLMRVARALTPADEAENWIFTAQDRVWRRDGGGWVAWGRDGDTFREHSYRTWWSDGDIRLFVAEQLIHYGVSGSSWHMEAH